MSTSFSGLTVENMPSGPVVELKHVYFPDTRTGYPFSYPVYGMIYYVSMRKQMSIDQYGVISDGTEKSYVNFNYPTVASSLTDAPAFTQRTESAGVSGGAASNYYYYGPTDYGSTVGMSVARPDGSTVFMSRADDPTSVANGLLQYREVLSGPHSYGWSYFGYGIDAGSSPQVTSFMKKSVGRGLA